MAVSTRWWYEHLTVGPKTQGCVYTLMVWKSHSGTENTWMCLHVGDMDSHLTVKQKTHGCVYTLVVWTSHSGTENTRLCLHVGGIDRHLAVERKTQGCVYTLMVWKSHSGTENTGCVYTLVVWTSHSGTENTGMCLHVDGMEITQWNRKHRMCLHVGGIDRHLTVEQKTQGCVYTLVVWTSHSGTENTWMCLHGDGMNTSPWNRKHRDVSRCLWYGHLTVEQKTQGCVYTLVVWTSHSGTKTHGCVCTLVVWTPHRVTENTGMCWWYEQTSRSETENTWMCLHVGGMDITQWNRKHRDVSTR